MGKIFISIAMALVGFGAPLAKAAEFAGEDSRRGCCRADAEDGAQLLKSAEHYYSPP